MANKQTLQDNNGNSIYPVTLANIIFDGDGNLLSDILKDFTEDINEGLSSIDKLSTNMNKINNELIPNISSNDTEEDDTSDEVAIYYINDGQCVNGDLFGVPEDYGDFYFSEYGLEIEKGNDAYSGTGEYFNKNVDFTNYNRVEFTYTAGFTGNLLTGPYLYMLQGNQIGGNVVAMDQLECESIKGISSIVNIIPDGESHTGTFDITSLTGTGSLGFFIGAGMSGYMPYCRITEMIFYKTN